MSYVGGVLSFIECFAVCVTSCFYHQNELLCCVLETLTHKELTLLTKIVELLHTMVQQPWRAENKMSAHTLGIACGLSLFPQLDPSKATAFTQYLVDNYDALNSSHSEL
jgi:hypothetical protein